MDEKPQVILITGPKHCGKSSVTFALRHFIKCRSGDLDSIIEKRTGKTPRELYLESPDIFKIEEAAKLAFILKKEAKNCKAEPLILATGGGIIDNHKAIKLIKNQPGLFVVYLEISAKSAWSRIKKTPNNMPAYLLKKSNPEALHRIIHETRAIKYRKLADITIDANNKTSVEIANEIITQTGFTMRHNV
jgi:shikimate kinase